MSSTSENHWRAQALQNMEQHEQEQLAPPVTGTSLGIVFAKIGLMIVLSIPLIFVGWGFLPALAVVGWYLFWPR